VRWWALALGCALAVAAALFPVLLRPLNRAWFRLGLLLGRIINPVVLAVLFHGVLTPFGVVMRGLGKDPLRLRPDPGRSSYWIERNPPGPAPGTMANQF
jgi:Saxitoxin biosynthesis operon protein SxtJ